MRKQHVLIIFGGNSNEYSVSLQSAAAVIDHMNRCLYEPILVGISEQGVWYRYFGNTDAIRQNTWQADPRNLPAALTCLPTGKYLTELHNASYDLTPIDVAFPILHGKNGEDGTIQGVLVNAQIPYVGCDLQASAICMDKHVAHQLVALAGIQVPAALLIERHQQPALERTVFTDPRFDDLPFPVYVKPVKSGSSIGITKVFRKQDLIPAIEQAWQHDDKVIIEQSIEGFEVGCALLGNASPVIGAVDEIELTGDFFDFHEKYSLETSKIHMPARIDDPLADAIKNTALKIYTVLGCQGMARVDLFVTPEREIVFNEVNTIPGFTANSRYPKMLSALGLSYADIIDRLLQLALEKEIANL